MAFHFLSWVRAAALTRKIPNEERLNRLSFYFGAGGQAMQEPPEVAPNEVDKKTGEALGRRVAEVTKRLGR